MTPKTHFYIVFLLLIIRSTEAYVQFIGRFSHFELERGQLGETEGSKGGQKGILVLCGIANCFNKEMLCAW